MDIMDRVSNELGPNPLQKSIFYPRNAIISHSKLRDEFHNFLQPPFSVNMHQSERRSPACFEMISIHLNLTLNNERFIAGYKNSSPFQICNQLPSSGRRSLRGTRNWNFLSSINNPSSMIRRWKLRLVDFNLLKGISLVVATF